MDDYRAELAEINLCCERLGISHSLLSVTDVTALTGWSRKAVKSTSALAVCPAAPC